MKRLYIKLIDNVKSSNSIYYYNSQCENTFDMKYFASDIISMDHRTFYVYKLSKCIC